MRLNKLENADKEATRIKLDSVPVSGSIYLSEYIIIVIKK